MLRALLPLALLSVPALLSAAALPEKHPTAYTDTPLLPALRPQLGRETEEHRQRHEQRLARLAVRIGMDTGLMCNRSVLRRKGSQLLKAMR